MREWIDDRKVKFQFTRPRGARLIPVNRRPSAEVFQFTRPRGARRPTQSNRTRGRSFQFTRPRGARLQSTKNKKGQRRFNSRAHVGRDYYQATKGLHQMQFQFTRPRGARRAFFLACRLHRLFQFTRPRGARRHCSPHKRPSGSFNSRAHVGRDTDRSRGAIQNCGFNSRAHVGRDDTA